MKQIDLFAYVATIPEGVVIAVAEAGARHLFRSAPKKELYTSYVVHIYGTLNVYTIYSGINRETVRTGYKY